MFSLLAILSPSTASFHSSRETVDAFFTEMHALALDKQAAAGYGTTTASKDEGTDENKRLGPMSGLPWITRSTPVTVNEIIDHLLVPMHHEMIWLVLHEDGQWEDRHTSSLLDAQNWSEGRQAILSWDVLFGYECAKDFLNEIEHLKFYLDESHYTHPEDPLAQDDWTNFHLGSHLGNTLATCMRRCPDPEFIHHQMKEFSRPLTGKEEQELIAQREAMKALVEELHQSSLTEAEDTSTTSPRTPSDSSTSTRLPREPIYCLDWSDAYLRMDMDNDETAKAPPMDVSNIVLGEL